MTNVDQIYSDTKFPERLFVLGAGPTLELIYPYRREMYKWGHWAVMRSDLVQPFLEFIEPLYSIRYNVIAARHQKVYGIPLEKPLGNITGPRHSFHGIRQGSHRGFISLAAFIEHFQSFGGKELFLFGFDGDSSSYWRGQEFDWQDEVPADPDKPAPPPHLRTEAAWEYDTDMMNKENLGGLTKLYHLGKTRNNFMIQVSIQDIKELII